MDTTDHLRDASPWRAEPDPKKLAILGKLSEELGELQAAVARCIIQGVDGVHPVTRKPNLEWLEEELVDVCNMISFTEHYVFGRTAGEISDEAQERIERKCAHIKQWLASFDVDLPFDENSKEKFIVAELLGSGWTAVIYWWNADFMGDGTAMGFWEPWETSFWRYKTQADADAYAKEWAKHMRIRYRPPSADKTTQQKRTD